MANAEAVRERQKLARENVQTRAAGVLPQELLWIEPATPAGRVSLGLSVNL